ncbi:hypothetical protein CCACVL1_04206 [Corchorus capsularis]|uniref:HMA domain-containing protein n=1 Tax=Corchorus capsularis TaxID=210143 RepID=A0A1R3JUK3_COCAP|nr:hypothetical protein CCACVL1_04206 [Corchorus capsularis]
MAKETDLEKIELKVSVNCCDGCKKKVKKALQSVEGVLKIEVDPQQPKVTVLGKVDPQKLIKRLSKVGKQAEQVRKSQNGAAPAEKKGEIAMAAAPNSVAKDKEHKSTSNEQAKPSSYSCANDKRVLQDEGGDKGTKKKEESKEQIMGNPNVPDARSYSYGSQYALTLPLPCYALAVPSSYAYAAALPLPLSQTQTQTHTCCTQECCHYQQPPLFHTPPATRVGDYFSDDNTLGCTVM